MFEDVNNGLEARNNEWLDALKQESAKKPKAYAELMEIKNRQKIDALNKQLDNDDMIVSMIGATDYGAGNFLDPAQIENVNKQRGTFGENGQPVNGQIRDAGYNENGDYQFDVWKQNPDGTMGVSSRVMPKKQVYGIMRHYADSGMFSQETIDGLRNSIQESDPSYTNSQFDALGSAYGQRRRMIEDQIGRTMYGVSGTSSRGGRGGLTFDQQKELAGDKYESYLMKNAMEMFNKAAASNPDMAADPKKAAEWVKGFILNMRRDSGGTDKPKSAVDAFGGSGPVPKPQVKPQAKPQAEPQVKPQAKPQAKPQVKPQAKPQAKPQVVETEPASDKEWGTEPASDKEWGTEPVSEKKTQAKPKTESVEAQDKDTTNLDDEKEAAWRKWYIENGRNGDDPKELRKRFEDSLVFDKKVKEKLKEGLAPGFLNGGR